MFIVMWINRSRKINKSLSNKHGIKPYFCHISKYLVFNIHTSKVGSKHLPFMTSKYCLVLHNENILLLETPWSLLSISKWFYKMVNQSETVLEHKYFFNHLSLAGLKLHHLVTLSQTYYDFHNSRENSHRTNNCFSTSI